MLRSRARCSLRECGRCRSCDGGRPTRPAETSSSGNFIVRELAVVGFQGLRLVVGGSQPLGGRDPNPIEARIIIEANSKEPGGVQSYKHEQLFD